MPSLPNFADRTLAVLADLLLRSSSGGDVVPRQEKEWLTKINDFVGDVSIGEGDEQRDVPINRLLDTADTKAKALEDKVNNRWNALPKKSKKTLLAAIATVQARGHPLHKPAEVPVPAEGDDAAESSDGGSNLLVKIAVAFVVYALVGQQMQAAIQGRDLFYRAVTLPMANKSITQFAGEFASSVFYLPRFLILAFQRVIVPAPVSFAIESTIGLPPGVNPPGYRAGTISSSLAIILGYISYKEWVGGENVRYLIGVTRFFLSPGSVDQEEADRIREEMEAEGEEWEELAEAFDKMRPRADPNDPADYTKGLSKPADTQAGDYQQALQAIIDFLRLQIKITKRSGDKSAMTWFAIAVAAFVLICTAPLPDTFVAFLGWAIFLAWRMDDQDRTRARTLDNSIDMFAQAGTLVLYSLPFIITLVVYRSITDGLNVFEEHPIVGKIAMAWLLVLNAFFADVPGRNASKLWKASADKRQKAGEKLRRAGKKLEPALDLAKCLLGPLIRMLARLGPLQRAIFAGISKVLEVLGFQKTKEAQELLRQLRARDEQTAAERASRNEAIVAALDQRRLLDVVVTALDEVAEASDDDMESLVDDLEGEDEDLMEELEEYAQDFQGIYNEFVMIEKGWRVGEEAKTDLGDFMEQRIQAAIDAEEGEDDGYHGVDALSMLDIAKSLEEMTVATGRGNDFHQMMFGHDHAKTE